MKISKGVRDSYENCTPIFKRLSSEVKERMIHEISANNWFYLSRIKSVESYALKLETGRFHIAERLEDMFACTLVVKNLSEIKIAEDFIRQSCNIIERRPKDDNLTSKSSSNFEFDDLRLYCTLKNLESGKNADLEELVFEIQIKTMLQHAWSVATHDLVYKTDSVSWSKERIAFQIKAMLEHAEVVIAEAANLSSIAKVEKKDKRTADTAKMIEHVDKIWPIDALPTDKKRLAENIIQLFKNASIDLEIFPEIIEQEIKRIGILQSDLSPYAFTIQAISNSKDLDFKNVLNKKSFKIKIVVHKDMDIPEWMADAHEKIIYLR